VKKILLSCTALSVLCLGSCKNDLDVVDDYRETMVVFGLLSPSDTAQYIKINKAFLGPDDAFVMAGVFDSNNYVNNEISARLERWLNGNMVETIQLYKDTVLPKDAGIFPYPGQIFYKTTQPILQDGSEYRLHVVNGESDKIVTSSTKILQNMTVVTPLTNATINLVAPTMFKAKWKTAANGRQFNLVVRMHYSERFVYDTLQVADKYIDLNFVDVRSTTLAGGEDLEQQISPENFFRNIKNSPQMDTSALKERFFKSLEFRFSGAAEEFATYMDVVQTTGSAFGDAPTYTNIDGGIGLFSSRFTHSVKNINLTAATKDSLKNGQYTYNLRFK
jgi:hypothetical protein